MCIGFSFFRLDARAKTVKARKCIIAHTRHPLCNLFACFCSPTTRHQSAFTGACFIKLGLQLRQLLFELGRSLSAFFQSGTPDIFVRFAFCKQQSLIEQSLARLEKYLGVP